MLVLADGFGLYGTGSTGAANMVLGAWSQADAPITVESANPRGLGSHHLRFPSTVQNDLVRRALGADYGVGIGFGAAYYLSVLPTDNTSHCIFQARDGSNNPQYTVQITTTGGIHVRTGDDQGTIVAQTTAPVVTAGTYYHIELFAVCGNAGGSPGGGSIEVRVNGQTVLLDSDIDLQAQPTTGVEQFIIGQPRNAAVWTGTMDVTDLHAWDVSGVVNNDFLGDVSWQVFYPTSDGTNQGWTPSATGDAFPMIDDATGPDGDTTYIAAAFSSPGAISDFGVTDVPATTSDIVGVVLQPMARKTDAGNGSMQVSTVQPTASPDAVDAGVDHTVTQSYAYYPEVFETDPATGVRWTLAGFNTTQIRLQRTA